MIREILVIHNSGVVLFGRNYAQNYIDDHRIARDLVGGFISVLGLFGRETFHDDLREIKFTTIKMIFKRTPNFFVTAIVDHEVDTEELRALLTEISRKFELQYGNDPVLDGVLGNDIYMTFSETVDQLTRPYRN